MYDEFEEMTLYCITADEVEPEASPPPLPSDGRMEPFQHVFIEQNEYNTRQYETGLRIYHAFKPCGRAVEFRMHDFDDHRVYREFITVPQDHFTFLDKPFGELLFDFDASSSCNPFKYHAVLRVCKCLQDIQEDLRQDSVTELLRRYLGEADVFCLVENYESARLYEVEIEGNEHFKADLIHWSCIFNHRQTIIDFYEGIIWYLTEHLSYDEWLSSECLNLGGLPS